MSNQDWFRKTTWTAQDQGDFFAHLKRSHNQNRAQYLKIQAHSLYETASLETIKAALELINLAITEYPQRIFLAEMYEQKAKCLNKLGNLQDAESAFQLAFDSMRAIPNIKPSTQFSFGLFVIEHKISRLYKEAIMVLDEFTDRLEFPFIEYYYYGIRAVILNREGNGIEAKSIAIKALQASEKEHSGFSRHPGVGLVNQPNEIIHSELQRLVR
jgi:tetratricopeptide (TPR) repeat protein